MAERVVAVKEDAEVHGADRALVAGGERVHREKQPGSLLPTVLLDGTVVRIVKLIKTGLPGLIVEEQVEGDQMSITLTSEHRFTSFLSVRITNQPAEPRYYPSQHLFLFVKIWGIRWRGRGRSRGKQGRRREGKKGKKRTR